MSTVCQRNKEKKRNTHLCVKEVRWNIALLSSYLRNAVFFPPSLSPASQSGRWIRRSATQFGVFSMCKSRRIQALCGWGGLGSPLAGFSQTQELVFWWFLLSYLTSAPCSCWYFLLLKQRIFWYYSSLQVMAILCCVAKKSSFRGTGTHKKWS